MVANGHDSQFQLDSGATVNVLPTNERLLCQLDGLKQLLRKRLEQGHGKFKQRMDASTAGTEDI